MGEMADFETEYLAEHWWFSNDRFPRIRGKGKCPKCGDETVLKEGKYGKFYGCINFPECNGSRGV